MAKRVFNPPPGWPVPPQGWMPPPGWQPDPSWPKAPSGWNFTRLEEPQDAEMPPQDTQLGPQDAAGPVEKAQVNRPSRLGQWVGVAVFALLVALWIAAEIASASENRDDSLRPGNCAKIDAADERYLIRVPCTDSSAQLRVTSRHDNTSDVDANCPRNAAAEPGYAFVEEQSDNTTEVNFVLCVAPK